uniref:Uncharacterized protein n=1 Tax=Salix viminalis TaxID=40686 RepID=A0A6N2KUY4_SALVM
MSFLWNLMGSRTWPWIDKVAAPLPEHAPTGRASANQQRIQEKGEEMACFFIILNKLKILNLSYSKDLVKTPNLHSTSLEKLLLEGCLNLVEGCRRLKALPQSICDIRSLEILNISECSQLEKLPEHMGGIESLTDLLANGINNEQFLASIEHLKYLRKLSLCGYNFNAESPSSTSWTSPISSLISASLLDWKALVPTCFTSWRLLTKLRLDYYGLSERTSNCVDLGGLVALEELNLSGNNFFSLPSSINVLPKLQILRVSHCRNLVSISELPQFKFLEAFGCKSMERSSPLSSLYGSISFTTIESGKPF